MSTSAAARAGLLDAAFRFRPLIDDKTGIIKRVDAVALSAWDPEVFLVYAHPSNTLPLAGLSAANAGAACSPDPVRAFVRACGESIERYCSAFFAIESLPLASEAAIRARGAPFVRARDVYPFSAGQLADPGFPYEAVADRPVRWVEARAWDDDHPVQVPASCVYVPYLFDRAVEPFTHMPISTGLAAGSDLESAIEKGVLEILERDAFMVTWNAQLPTRRIDPASCRGQLPEIDALLEHGGTRSRWHINVLTLDVDVPILSAALVDRDDPPLTSFGIAANVDPVRALLLALEEAALTRVLLNRSPQVFEPWPDDRPIDNLRAHMLVHAARPSLRHSLRFLFESTAEVGFAEYRAGCEARSESLRARLAEAGFAACWTELTTPDVGELGFRVVRSIVPGMQPLDDDHAARYLGGDRIVDLARRKGRGDFGPEHYNPDPHPFP